MYFYVFCWLFVVVDLYFVICWFIYWLICWLIYWLTGWIGYVSLFVDWYIDCWIGYVSLFMDWYIDCWTGYVSLLQLNAWNPRQAEEPDYTVRLDTFRSVMQQLKDWTEVDVDFLLPLIYNCCFFIKNVSSGEGLHALLVKVFMLPTSPPLHPPPPPSPSSASHICDSCLFSCVGRDLIVSLAA